MDPDTKICHQCGEKLTNPAIAPLLAVIAALR